MDLYLIGPPLYYFPYLIVSHDHHILSSPFQVTWSLSYWPHECHMPHNLIASMCLYPLPWALYPTLNCHLHPFYPQHPSLMFLGILRDSPLPCPFLLSFISIASFPFTSLHFTSFASLCQAPFLMFLGTLDSADMSFPSWTFLSPSIPISWLLVYIHLLLYCNTLGFYQTFPLLLIF